MSICGTEPGSKDQGFRNKLECGICPKIEAETVSSVFYSYSLVRLSLMTESTMDERGEPQILVEMCKLLMQLCS